MNSTASSTFSPTSIPRPIPARTRFNSTHHTHHNSSNKTKRQSIPPSARPEVISNLITSLSDISKSTEDYLDYHSPSTGACLSVPVRSGSGIQSASSGSFGVVYGTYNRPSSAGLPVGSLSLDEVPASSPVIRTSKPPSGYSPLTASKKGHNHQSPTSRENGFRSLIRNNSGGTSRPSSGGSVPKSEAQSIGTVSIEPRIVPEPELRKQRSCDSWGKKATRSAKGLIYMSSKERLRDREAERRHGAAGVMSNNDSHNVGTGHDIAVSTHTNNGPDSPLTKVLISEEPLVTNNAASLNYERMGGLRRIPVRSSSLKKEVPKSKHKSRQPNREGEEAGAQWPMASEKDTRTPKWNTSAQPDLPSPSNYETFSINHLVSGPISNHGRTPSTQQFLDSLRDDYLAFSGGPQVVDDESAPFPAVSQGRTRSNHSVDSGCRRRSIPQSPTTGEDGRPKRSRSRLKRRSQQTSPALEGKAPSDQHREESAAGVPLERVNSVDSVNEAVESYLAASRLTQKIKHPQTGRVICFSEVGDPNGSAVFCCVGMGLTRYITAFYDELALTLKLRLITPDRPGVGESEPYSDGNATPLSWPDDIYAICQSLKITKFSILAHSAGAIYALATALRMPQHIRGRIHLLAPWIPPSQMNTFGGSRTSPPTNAIPTSQRILRALPTPMLKVANSSFMSATSTSITTSLPKNPKRLKRKSEQTNPRDSGGALDKDNERARHDGVDGADDGTKGNTNVNGRGISRQGEGCTGSATLNSAVEAEENKERQMVYDVRLTHGIWALATTGANPAVDLMTCLERRHTIGFRYVDINRPVIIHHGSRDTRVPVDNVRWLGKTMRRCEVRVLEGEGHGLMASATVMGSVLMEISKEWDDWMRVTRADVRMVMEREKGKKATVV